jgi:hypothetical protein
MLYWTSLDKERSAYSSGYVLYVAFLTKLHKVLKLVNINHILALTETHLDASVNDGQINIHGYSLLRRDRNRNGVGVALYIQNHMPWKRRDDLNVCQVEALWPQVDLPDQTPILLGCVYRPLSSKVSYLDDKCTGFDQATDSNRDAQYLSGVISI